jgi:hypothetical protein
MSGVYKAEADNNPEITPEMIEAGVEAFANGSFFDTHEEIVCAVFLAMKAVNVTPQKRLRTAAHRQ